MAVSKRLRFEVMRRDGHACHYCGRKPPEVTLQVDHVVPVALGGKDEPGNLVTACPDCNSGKSSSPADAEKVAQVNADAERWAAAIKQAGQQQREEQTEIVRWFKPLWYGAAEAVGSTRVARDLDTNKLIRVVDSGIPLGQWPNSVKAFLTAGLSRDQIEECVQIAMHADIPNNARWRYFCGVGWNRVRQLQDRAAELLAEDEFGAQEDSE